MGQVRQLRSPHVFISFKTEERDIAFALKSVLEAGGFSVWWQENIQCGREWHGDIDDALAMAGCVVVLWSPESIKSQWVRHEASQAVARGVYTPVRLVPMDIGRPFDRIQATDLFGWTPEHSHPGLTRLLQRIDSLVPQPLTPAQRVLRAIRRNRTAITSSAVAVAAVALLLRLSFGLEQQLKAQSDIAESIQRTLQPLDGFRVSAFVTVNPAIPGVPEYVQSLRKALPTLSQGTLPKVADLPKGLSAARSNASGLVEEVRIAMDSHLWPRDSGTTTLGTVFRYIGLNVSFTAPATGSSEQGSDLSFDVGAYDPDGSEQGRLQHSIQLDLTSNLLTLSFTDVPSRASWRASGRIVSVPDLERSAIAVEIDSTMYASLEDAAGMEKTDDARRMLALDTLFLDYSGRKVMFRTSGMQSGTGTKGMRLYRGQFSTAVK